MDDQSLAHDVEVAWTRACDGLGLPRGTTLGADEASVLFKYLVAEGAAVPGAPACSAARRARTALRAMIEAGLGALERALTPGALRAAAVALADDPRYGERIVDLAVADLVSEPMAPEVCIALRSRAGLAADGSCWNHAVVFSEAPLVTHELYPLVVDATVHDARDGGPFFRVLGVHGDWLRHGSAHRVLYLDTSRDRFVETDLDLPVALDSVHLLALGKRQSERHRCWSANLPCSLVNPWPAAAAAEDKDTARRRWRHAGLDVPRGERLEAGAHDRAHSWLAAGTWIVVKPNRGAGRHVLFIDGTDADAVDRLETHLAACWEWGPVLIEARRDGVSWRCPETGRRHSLALRLHVSRCGDRVRAESGYARIGAGADTPTGDDGSSLQPLSHVLDALVRRVDGSPVTFGDEDLARVRAAAEAACRVQPPLGLAGVDLVLDLAADGRVRPVLLDLDPRPSGLAHARFLPGAGTGRGEAGVSLAVWDGVARTAAVERARAGASSLSCMAEG